MNNKIKYISLLSFLGLSLSAVAGGEIVEGKPYVLELSSGANRIVGDAGKVLKTTAEFDDNVYYRTIFWLEKSDGGYFLRTGSGKYLQQSKEKDIVRLGDKNILQEYEVIKTPDPCKFTLKQASGNTLFHNQATNAYLNMYYGTNGGLALWTGSGDASQWKIKEKETGSIVTSVKEGTEYYLVSSSSGKNGQLAYYSNGNLFLKEGADASCVFTFILNADNTYTIHNVSANANIVQGAIQQNLQVKDKVTVIERKDSIVAETFTIAEIEGSYHLEALTNSGYALGMQGDSLAYLTKATASSWTLRPYTGNAVPILFPKACTYYKFSLSSAATTYMNEAGDGSLSSATYDTDRKCFWEFIPTSKEHCYYIRNAVSGRYVQSTKLPSTTPVELGNEPVEFFVGEDTQTGATTYGYYYMSSTDNETASEVSASTMALNKTGSGSAIIAYSANHGNKNTFWKLEETDLNYEIHPFTASEELGSYTFKYSLSTLGDRNVTVTDNGLVLSPKSVSKEQAFYFVGNSNNAEGYLIASVVKPDQTLNLTDNGVVISKSDSPTRWHVLEANGNPVTRYYFRPFEKREIPGSALSVDGDSLFILRQAREDYALHTQIYQMPCGVLGEEYLSSVKISGKDVLKELTYESSVKPTSWYTLYTNDKGVVGKGTSFDLNMMTLGTVLETVVFVYFDWNNDGVFETMYNLGNGTYLSQEISVPSDAQEGKTRMRVRITNNLLMDAEDEVVGQIADFIINVTASQQQRTVKVNVNGAGRGVVTLSDVADSYPYGTLLNVTAEPKGNAEFICWKEGNRIVSVNPTHMFSVTHNIDLTAYFSPNLKGTDDVVGIYDKVVNNAFLYNVISTKGSITIDTDATVKDIKIYSSDGALMLSSKLKHINVSSLPKGIYVVKIYTSDGTGSKALSIN